MNKRVTNYCYWLIAAVLLLGASSAHAANDYIVAPSGGDITGTELSAQLANGNVTLQSSLGGKAGSGNVIINDVVTWSADNTLTLTASNNVTINANISVAGTTAGLVISPNTANRNEQPSGHGSYTLNGTSITLSGTTPALTIAGTSFAVINSLGSAVDATTAPVTPTLQGMAAASNLTKKFALGSDIDASATSDWNGGQGFTPIGPWGTGAFTGTLDGLGHTITNLTIKQAPIGGNNSGGQVGLFGTLDSGGVIKNVGLTGCSIGSTTGSNTIAGLVSRNLGDISNSYVIGVVSGNPQGPGDSLVGGLVGINFGNIHSSYVVGSVTDSNVSNIGGLTGSNQGNISSSYAVVTVSGMSGTMGGLAGANSGTISSSYVTGRVTGSGVYIGGLVGINCDKTSRIAGCAFLNKTGSINNTYVAVSLTPANSSTGGALVGGNGGTISTGYWNSDITENGIGTNTGTAGAKGLNTRQMQTASSFIGFPFTTEPGEAKWVIVDNDGTLNNANGADGATYPMLASEYSTTIVNAHQLQLMAMNPAADYMLNGDIDASGTSGVGDVWGSAGFAPIGSYSAPFPSSFDGQRHTINNLTIKQRKLNRVGLFGVVGSSATINNTVLKGGSVSGSGSVGGLAGINNGTVTNCRTSDAVKGYRGGFVGGMIGSNNGTVSNSQASGNVSGTGGFRGGLIGVNNGTITSCSATGTVTGQGGFTGKLIGINNVK